jgi:hypothetical protein
LATALVVGTIASSPSRPGAHAERASGKRVHTEKETAVTIRKSTWAIAIWTGAMGVAILTAASGIGQDCAGFTGGELTSCQADAWGRGIIGLALLGLLWFVVFVPLWFVWRASRPNQAAGA